MAGRCRRKSLKASEHERPAQGWRLPIAGGSGGGGGGGGLGLGLGAGAGAGGRAGRDSIASRLEQERLREQREREQLEQALRMSQEMAQQEEATRAAAEYEAAAARRAGAAAPAGAQGLFAGCTHVDGVPAGAAGVAAVPSSIYSPDAPASPAPVHDPSAPASFHPASQALADAGAASAFSFLRATDGEAATGVDGAGTGGLPPAKQTIEPAASAGAPTSMVWPSAW